MANLSGSPKVNNNTVSNCNKNIKRKKGLKSACQRDTCTPMLSAMLFRIAKVLKNKCPSTNEWIKDNVEYIQSRQHKPLKKKEILSFATTRMDVRDIMLSQISQTQKDKYYLISFI
jgi:hypothetical protein